MITRLLLDEGLPLRAAKALREQGIDALHAREAGLTSAPDHLILDFGHMQDRVCVTLDHDFHRLLAETSALQPSVILLRIPGLDYKETSALIVRIVAQVAPELINGAAVTATQRGIRLRRLPLK